MDLCGCHGRLIFQLIPLELAKITALIEFFTWKCWNNIVIIHSNEVKGVSRSSRAEFIFKAPLRFEKQ